MFNYGTVILAWYGLNTLLSFMAVGRPQPASRSTKGGFIFSLMINVVIAYSFIRLYDGKHFWALATPLAILALAAIVASRTIGSAKPEAYFTRGDAYTTLVVAVIMIGSAMVLQVG